MSTTHHLFEIETEREGMDSVRGLVGRLRAAAAEAGGSLTTALVTADLDHLFAVAEVPDGAALSAAVLRTPLPGVIWFTGPDPVEPLGERAPGTGQVVADYAFADPEDAARAVPALAAAAERHGCRMLAAWRPAGGAGALVVYGSASAAEVRELSAAAGTAPERLEPARDLIARQPDGDLLQ